MKPPPSLNPSGKFGPPGSLWHGVRKRPSATAGGHPHPQPHQHRVSFAPFALVGCWPPTLRQLLLLLLLLPGIAALLHSSLGLLMQRQGQLHSPLTRLLTTALHGTDLMELQRLNGGLERGAVSREHEVRLVKELAKDLVVGGGWKEVRVEEEASGEEAAGQEGGEEGKEEERKEQKRQKEEGALGGAEKNSVVGLEGAEARDRGERSEEALEIRGQKANRESTERSSKVKEVHEADASRVGQQVGAIAEEHVQRVNVAVVLSLLQSLRGKKSETPGGTTDPTNPMPRQQQHDPKVQQQQQPSSLHVALLNLNAPQPNRSNTPSISFHSLPFTPLPATILWSDIFPSWYSNSSCHPIPWPAWANMEPSTSTSASASAAGITSGPPTAAAALDAPPDADVSIPWTSLDGVAVMVPCNASQPHWGRDPQRHFLLHLTAVAAARTSKSTADIIIFSSCRPTPNLFHCRHLLESRADIWHFRIPTSELKERLKMPFGTCQFAPLPSEAPRSSPTFSREAYVTVLHSKARYVCGAIMLAHSIRRSGGTRELLLLHTSHVPVAAHKALKKAGWRMVEVERIPNPRPKNAYNKWNYSKLRIWQMEEYSRLILLDADMLVLRNIDFLFAMPEVTARFDDAHKFNSGLMVVEPASCTFDMLMGRVADVESDNGGDQGFLNEVFTWWHKLPQEMNFMKHVLDQNDASEVSWKSRLFLSSPPQLFVVHYLGRKPWRCFRDVDCNWFFPLERSFANDGAHKKWWQLHDSMARSLQKQCLMSEREKADVEFNRYLSKEAKTEDRRWRVSVTDPRQDMCRQKGSKKCEWRSEVENMKSWWEKAKQIVRSSKDGREEFAKTLLHFHGGKELLDEQT